jgi:hypothetical protein
MEPLKAMITACVVLFALLLAACIYLGERGTIKMEQPGQGARSHSDLEQDEMALAADMRKLRKNLRRGVNPLQITQERDEIRRDWLNIVADRGLEWAEASPSLVNLGPQRWFSPVATRERNSRLSSLDDHASVMAP